VLSILLVKLNKMVILPGLKIKKYMPIYSILKSLKSNIIIKKDLKKICVKSVLIKVKPIIIFYSTPVYALAHVALYISNA
jgi:hypothetical protein